MSSLQILQGVFRINDTRVLRIDALMLEGKSQWAFVGANGSGKSALARALSSELPLLEGSQHSDFPRVSRLSFEQLQQLVTQEWQRNNTDMLSADEDDTGRTTAEVIQDEIHDPGRPVWHHSPALAPF